MNEQQFLIWLKGFSDGINETPNAAQWKIIHDKLNKTYHRIIPSEGLQSSYCLSGVASGSYLGHKNGFGHVSG